MRQGVHLVVTNGYPVRAYQQQNKAERARIILMKRYNQEYNVIFMEYSDEWENQ